MFSMGTGSFYKYILLPVMLAMSVTCFSQELVYKTYSTENGLPGNEVYDIHQDRKGFVWFATDKGLARFDGHNFKIFTTANGLAENVNFSIHEDRKGVLWFASFSKGISCYDGQKFYIPSCNEELKKLIGPSSWVANMEFDKDHSVWMSLKRNNVHNTFYKISPDGKLSKHTFKASVKSPALLLKVDENYLEMQNGYMRTKDTFRTRIENRVVLVDIPELDIRNAINLGNNEIFLASGKHTARAYPDGRIERLILPYSCNRLVSKTRDFMWAATQNALILIDLKKKAISATYFNGHNITDVICDNEGNYWISTQDAGVFMVSWFGMRRIGDDKLASSKINNVVCGQKGVYFTTFQGLLYRVGLDNQAVPVNYGKLQHVNAIISSGDEIYLSNGNKINEKSGKISDYLRSSGKCITPLKSGLIASGYVDGLELYSESKVTWSSGAHGFNYRVTALAEDDKEVLWIGTLFGLFSLQANDSADFTIKRKRIDKRINTISFSKGRLIVGTTESGLFGYDNEKELFNLTETDGLASNFINHVFIENDTTWWVSTPKGLSLVVASQQGKFQIRNFTRNDGLPVNEVNGATLYNNKLWLATDKGLVFFDPGEVQPLKKRFNVYITRFSVNEADTIISSEYSLGYDQRNIRVVFAGISHRYPEKLLYHYRLEGLETKWAFTRDKNLSFANLPPGTYRLRLAASVIGFASARGPETVITFTIARH